MTKDQRELLESFGRVYEQKIQEITASGAGPKETVLVGKYALILAADQFAPLSKAYRRELENLRHLV